MIPREDSAGPQDGSAAPEERGELDLLIPMVYDHLRALAGKLMGGRDSGFTLQPTGLVHEAYLRLMDQRLLQWQDRHHFFHIAARVMRRVLVDHCRARAAKKRGGGEVRMTLAGTLPADPAPEIDVLAVDRILTVLETLDPQQAQVVELRFFAGLTVEETAEAIGISKTTVKREWALARASILVELAEGPPKHGS
jgi:RNA polymerase sigma-70 factor (ECF subfamily)